MNICYDAIVLAAGRGVRAGLSYNKIFYALESGCTVLESALKPFLDDSNCLNLIVVTKKEEAHKIEERGKIKICFGGKERSDSVFNGLKLVTSEYVFVHDGARPYLDKADLEALKKEVLISKAAILATSSSDAVKMVRNNKIVKSLNKQEIYLAQTPQACLTSYLKKAYANKDVNKIYYDEAELLADTNIPVTVVKGSLTNKKITYPTDLR